MKPVKKNSSPQTQQEALAMAKATQKPNQTKEQTKLIAQGIEKGITLYKKQQKEKQREADKQRKKLAKQKSQNETLTIDDSASTPAQSSKLPWLLLLLSWTGFSAYLFLFN